MWSPERWRSTTSPPPTDAGARWTRRCGCCARADTCCRPTSVTPGTVASTSVPPPPSLHCSAGLVDPGRTSEVSHVLLEHVRWTFTRGIEGATAAGLCLLYTSDAADDLLCVDLG